MKATKTRGGFLLETLLAVTLIGVVWIPCHLALIRRWRAELIQLENLRLRYDGRPVCPRVSP